MSKTEKRVEPEFVIVIEDGCVVNVGVTGHDVTYRVIDIDVVNYLNAESVEFSLLPDPDAIKTGNSNSGPVHDYVPDAENIDVEEYTKEMLKGVKK